MLRHHRHQRGLLPSSASTIGVAIIVAVVAVIVIIIATVAKKVLRKSVSPSYIISRVVDVLAILFRVSERFHYPCRHPHCRGIVLPSVGIIIVLGARLHHSKMHQELDTLPDRTEPRSRDAEEKVCYIITLERSMCLLYLNLTTSISLHPLLRCCGSILTSAPLDPSRRIACSDVVDRVKFCPFTLCLRLVVLFCCP